MALRTDREKIAHLLRRFGLGSSESELEYYGKSGYAGAVELLLNAPADDGFHLDPFGLREASKKPLDMRTLTFWWTARILATPTPLRERMTIFWHNHFATSAAKVKRPEMMLDQNEIFRTQGLGKFRDLLGAASKDPAMLFWLDNQENVRGKPNENFAREVMELFTLGVGNYTENDVKEAARAFTGWSSQRKAAKGSRPYDMVFLERAGLHDGGSKTVLGRTGALSGDDVLDTLCAQPRCAEFLVDKIWRWFVYPDPSPATLKPFVQKFRDSGLDMAVLLRAIMLSPEFLSDKAERSIVKSPIDFCAVTLRQLGVGALIGQRVSETKDNAAQQKSAITRSAGGTATMKDMGMWLLYPPDVSGWKNGPDWISTATMVVRIGWSDRIFSQKSKVKYPIRYSAKSLLGEKPSPEQIVDRLLSVFDAPLKPERKPLLVEAARKAGNDPNEAAAAVSRLIFAAPEFQFC